MNTREPVATATLIEAVREKPNELPYFGMRVVNVTDYDSLEAACKAVLDEVDEAMSFLLSSDVTDKQCLRARDNARALREKLR